MYKNIPYNIIHLITLSYVFQSFIDQLYVFWIDLNSNTIPPNCDGL